MIGRAGSMPRVMILGNAQHRSTALGRFIDSDFKPAVVIGGNEVASNQFAIVLGKNLQAIAAFGNADLVVPEANQLFCGSPDRFVIATGKWAN